MIMIVLFLASFSSGRRRARSHFTHLVPSNNTSDDSYARFSFNIRTTFSVDRRPVADAEFHFTACWRLALLLFIVFTCKFAPWKCSEVPLFDS